MDTATEAVLPLVPSDEERQIRDAVRGICDGFPEDYARRKHEAGEPPTELWDALAAKGYLGVNLPEEWGGGGLGMTGLATVGEEIASAGKSLLLIVVSPAIVGNILARHGTDAQKERWLRGIAAGTTKIAFAITEPDAGTNSHNLATSVERRGDRLLLRGQKTYISGVEHADAVLVVARSRMADGSLGLPSLAIVDVDTPGFTRDQIPMPYLGPDKQWTLFFDDVELEEERLIGGEGGGLGPVFDGLNPERIMGAAIACGAGRRALGKAAAYANGRADRDASGHRAPARRGEDRARAGPPDDAEGVRALRRGRAGRGRVEQHGEVRRRRGGDQVRGPRDPGARRQRLRTRVRAVGHVVGRTAHADRARLARDDPELRRRALAGASEELLRMPGASSGKYAQGTFSSEAGSPRDMRIL
jgi:alkylation response protein AidB-like acyl-CoA dehydrogenase